MFAAVPPGKTEGMSLTDVFAGDPAKRILAWADAR
jgi:hypothetical protein